MGHQRLGDIPKTQKFKAVVEQVVGFPSGEGGAAPSERVSILDDVALIASSTLEAASDALDAAATDIGVQQSVFLLAKLVQAARDEDKWREKFRLLGVSLEESDSVYEFTSGVRFAISDYCEDQLHYSDASEIARQAAVESLNELTRDNARTLFGEGAEELRDAVAKLGTKAGFERLGQEFFGRFLAHHLNFYISRATPGAVRNERLDGLVGLNKFNESLTQHCHESAVIVRKYAGDWYSKANWQTGIDREAVNTFVRVALTKLRAELQVQGGGE